MSSKTILITDLTTNSKAQQLFYELNNHFENKIQLISLYYSGFHNFTFQGKLDNQLVQIRIPNNDFVNHDAEELVLKNDPDYLYYHKGVFVKKWFNGKTLNEIELTDEKQLAILNELKKFQNQKINNIGAINWNTYGEITDERFKKYLSYFKKQNWNITHGDLNNQNILIDDNLNVKFIDFEWVRLNHFAFDLISLLDSCSFSLENIQKVFKVSLSDLNKMRYMCQKLSEKAFEIKYSKLDFEKLQMTKITGGLSNENYRFSNYFLQLKVPKFQAFKVKYSKFNKLNFVPKVLYEDSTKIIRKYIDSQKIDFEDKGILRKIVLNIKAFHNAKLGRLPKNNLYERSNYYAKANNELAAQKLKKYLGEKQYEKLMLLLKNIPNVCVSHNDLNEKNILLDQNKKIWFIDFEYTTSGHPYIDLAYFSSSVFMNDETEKWFLLTYDSNINFDLYYQFKLLINFYGILWMMFLFPETDFLTFDRNIENLNKYLKYIDVPFNE
ncbi:phosphotransferase [Mycoplasmopsis columbinasalis]|uniref:3-deoxy-D-manno-octulosonic-acid kinase n=1 Tax=Mycoplasmopsis columbinasalis TaxID=114880 RepID=A0A449BAZ6_9BACT|nr:phosphotransferase [Mycoplasmopsis columbinasalis]VEU78354.1 3-deoxy-D-manno-octulosonic-acid kinase [Mycoplasmopsis columbinasalis]